MHFLNFFLFLKTLQKYKMIPATKLFLVSFRITFLLLLIYAT